MSQTIEIKQSWNRLSQHYSTMKNIHMLDLFKHDPERTKKFSLELHNLFFDYSKNIINTETLDLLFKFATANNIKTSIDAMFSGEKINITENRAVLHTALRCPATHELIIEGTDAIKQVHTELNKIKKFVASIHNGSFTGWTGKPLDTYVNIGIGGSNLGPKMVVNALDSYRKNDTKSFFISNIDEQQIINLKKNTDPEKTLFIVSSKSFTTLETIVNTETLIAWMKAMGCTAINKHFIAISSNTKAAIKIGIAPENIFSTWDWVGGRFSLWSATGLPIALALGFNHFETLLMGAHDMDMHFKKAAMRNNIPIILALLDFWYSNFFDAETIAFIPYDERLELLPDYLAQLFMESNGKSSDMAGNIVNYQTIPIIWGAIGTDAQHAFFQLLHQGTRFVPVEFLGSLINQGNRKHHSLLLANCLAQSQTLMNGKKDKVAYQYFPGNKPSTTILYKTLNPNTLGMLLALYEHRTFVQSLLWRINAFDQWGVELGKKWVSKIDDELESIDTEQTFDSSTRYLIDLYKKYNHLS